MEVKLVTTQNSSMAGVTGASEFVKLCMEPRKPLSLCMDAVFEIQVPKHKISKKE
jgi:hypothetical protein